MGLLLFDQLIQLLHIHLLQFFQLSSLLSLFRHQTLRFSLDTLQLFHLPVDAFMTLIFTLLDDSGFYYQDPALLDVGIAGTALEEGCVHLFSET